MRWSRTICKIAAFGACLGGATAIAETVKPAPKDSTAYIKMRETVISGNAELPKVLYIVPWRDPTGLPDIELDARFTELEVFRRLYPPAYRRELDYYETLSELETEE